MKILFILMVISVSVVNDVRARLTLKLYVKPKVYNPGIHCPPPCLLLSDLLIQPKKYFKSNTQIVFLAGDHFLGGIIQIVELENLTFIGQHPDKISTISCMARMTQIHIKKSTNVNILNIWFKGCGAHHQMGFEAISSYIAAALVYFKCTATQIVNTKFENSIGHSIIIMGMKGTSKISNSSFFHTGQQTGYWLLYSGVLVHYGYLCNATTALVFQECHFYNLDGKSLESPPSESERIGTALTITNLPLPSHHPLQQVNVTIVDSSFTNCICYTGPLINVQLQLNDSIRLLFNNVTISKNRIIIYFQQHQIISLIQIKGFSYQIQQITFKHCMISNNTVTGHLLLTQVTTDVSLIRKTKSYSSFHIDRCIFTYNRAVNGLVVVKNSMVFMSLRDSKFKHNRVCDIHMEGEIISESLLHIVSNSHIYNGASCSILTNYFYITSFTGYNEFSFNELNSDYLWMVDDHIVLEEGTIVNISSNKVGDTMVELTGYRSGSINKMFPPCPIQFVSTKGNLDKQFKEGIPLNYSLVFKDNVEPGRQRTPKILLGRTFKDCFWLPGTAFKTSHAATVAKTFVTFDNDNDNVAGYPYNGCLCYKNITHCLTDSIGHIYPGETVGIGFKLLGIESVEPKQNLFQSVLKFWNTNSSCAMSLISPLRRIAATTECTYFKYTITLPLLNQNATECTFVHQYGTLLYNIYFVNIMPCPSGFLLINGKCSCHPKLEHDLQLTSCNIDNQTILRPSNTWMMYSNKTRDVLYVEECPFHYCLSSSLYIQLSDPDKQCSQNRRGILCGQCSEGYSAVFGSSSCRECSNTWLSSIAIFMMSGLLLVLCLFNINVDLKSTSLTSLLLYVSILNTTSSNIIDYDRRLSTRFGFILISLLNFDLGFELCFYNGMTEYAKQWLQFAFPIYIICLTFLLLHAGKMVPFIQRLTAYNRNFTPAILVLIFFSKFPLIFSKCLLFICKLNYLESTKKKYLWAIDPRTTLFTSKHLHYFIFCTIVGAIFIAYNLILLLPRWFTRLRNRMQFLDAFKEILKEKHAYWSGLGLLLRLMIAAFLALDRKLSLLLNVLIVLMFITYLSITCPFKDNRHTIVEWNLLMNLIFIFSCSLYYGQIKTETYFIIVKMLVVCGFLIFLLAAIYNLCILKVFGTFFSRLNTQYC